MRTRLALAAAFLMLPLAAWAQRVTVDLVQVPIQDVLEELERDTEARIVSTFRADADQPLVDLQVQDVPLRAALRIICQQADCYFRQSSKGYYVVYSGPDPAADCPTAQVGPYIVRLRSIRVTDTMTLRFERGYGEPLSSQNTMTLTLTVEADEDADLERVAALDPAMTAVENTGKTISAPESESKTTSSRSRSYTQGRLHSYITLNRPSPEAVSLRRLEGNIVLHRDVEPVRLEFPLDGGPASQSAAGYSLNVTNIEQIGERGYQVQAELRGPTQAAQPTGFSSYRPSPQVHLLTADGDHIKPGRTTPIYKRVGKVLMYTWTWQFWPDDGLVPETFVCEFLAKSAETETLQFAFQDVPLPTWQE